jgi:hypothetical protein
MSQGGNLRRDFLRVGAGAATGAAALQAAQPGPAPARSSTYNVREMGATGDGTTMDTASIQRTLDLCATGGGGTVVMPPGKYLSGPVRIGSRTTLHLEAGAVLQGSPKLEDYRKEENPVSGESARSGLVTARDAEDVAITGRGTIDGSSMAFHDETRLHTGVDYAKEYTRQGAEYRNPKYGTQHGPLAHGERPGNLVRFLNCRNVLLSGVTISNSPTWTVQLHTCSDSVVRGVTIHSRASGNRVPNDDGIDLRECRNVHISDATIDTGDDCIALFGSSGLTVTNCTLTSRSAGIRAGFDNGETRNCVFSNLVIDSNRGVNVNVRGEGSVEDLIFSNLVIRTRLFTGHWWGKGEPVNISALPWSKTAKKLGRIRNIWFDGINAESEAGILIHGCPESVIEGVRLERVRLRVRKSPLEEGYGGNFDLRSTNDLRTALFAHDIPGLYFRHVDDLRVKDFDVSWEDGLAAFFTNGIAGEDFEDVEIRGFRGRQAHVGAGSPAAIQLARGEGISIRDCRAAAGTGTFLEMKDVRRVGLVSGNDVSAARVSGLAPDVSR